MFATHYAQNRIADAVFRGFAPALPETWFIALYTSAPDPAGGGTEAAYPGYARAAIPATASDWTGTGGEVGGPSTGVGGHVANAVEALFGGSPGTGPTVVTHLALFDAAVGGNMWFFAPLATAKTINADDAPVALPPAALSAQVTQ